MGEFLPIAVKTIKTIKKVIYSQKERDRIRIKALQYILLILMLAWIYEVGKIVLAPNVIIIDVQAASNPSHSFVSSVSPNGSERTEEPISQESISNSPEENVRVDEAKADSTPDVESLIKQTFPENPEIAIAISKAESRENTQAVGDLDKVWPDGRNGMSCGIMQVRVFPGRPDCDRLKDLKTNLNEARKIYDSKLKNGGKVEFSAWSTFVSGEYKNYL